MTQIASLDDLFRRYPEWTNRRLILHGGAIKTGTTSLQFYLADQREMLAAHGILYPAEGTAESFAPKHQWLNRHLFAQPDEGLLAGRLARCFDEADAGTHTMILSTEGVFNHWWDYQDDARTWLSTLARAMSLQCVIWLREPVSFFKSQYVQYLKNPQGLVAYGLDIAPQAMLGIPWVAQHFAYEALVADMGRVLGTTNLFPFAYTRDIVSAFSALLNVPVVPAARQNVTALSAQGVAMLRIVNRAALNPAAKDQAYALVEQINTILGERAAPYELEPAVVDKVRTLCPATRESLAAMDAESRRRWAEAWAERQVEERG